MESNKTKTLDEINSRPTKVLESDPRFLKFVDDQDAIDDANEEPVHSIGKTYVLIEAFCEDDLRNLTPKSYQDLL